MSVPNNPRIGFRPNIYARPSNSSPVPRAPVPSSRNRMLKPGFETSTTSYSHPAARRSQDKSPEPLPRKLEPYPVLSHFMFADEELKNTPSHRQHDISLEEEITLRRAGTFFIKELCRRLNAPFSEKRQKISPRAMCVAMIHLHRFYMFHSLGTFDPMHIGTASLFLAAKCEECPRKLSHFSKQFYSMLHPDDPTLLENDELDPVNDLITTLENSILSTVAFELNIDLPHVDVIQAPFTSSGDRLRKLAYQFSTDLLTTTILCIQYESKTLAAVCFFVAAAYLDINMDKEFGDTWYLKLDRNLTEDALCKIAKSFTNDLRDCKFILRAERIPRPNEPSRGESSNRVSEIHQPSEVHIKDASNEVRPHSRDGRSRETVSQEHRHPPSYESRARERIMPKEPRVESSKKDRTRASYDQSRDRAPENVNQDRPRASYEHRTPDISQQDRPKSSLERPTPDVPHSNRPKAPYERRTPELLQHERPRVPSRTPEAPAYESTKSSHGHRTPDVSGPQRSKVPFELVREHPTSEASSHGRTKSHATNPELRKQSHVQTRDHELNQSFEKSFMPLESSSDRHKLPAEKPIRSRENLLTEARYHDLEAPLLVPPPLPPPNSELRKRKAITEEEVPPKRSVETATYHSTNVKQRFEQVDFSLPPPPLPPPYDRRASLPVREQGDSGIQRNNFSKVSTNFNYQQQQISRRDETRHSFTHNRSELHRSNNNSQHFGSSSKDTSLQRSPQHKDSRKRDMMQSFVPAQNSSSKSGNRHSHGPPTFDELEEGEIQ